VKDAVIQIKKGQKIIGDGELVTQDHLRMLAAMRAQTERFDVVEASAGTAVLVALCWRASGPSTARPSAASGPPVGTACSWERC
jgi:hypothetical protein